jgi:curli biogenesis system outer membrane secretion channel CsgG
MLIPGAPVEEGGNLEHLKLRNSWAKIKVDLLVLNQDNLDILQVSNISGQVKNSEFIFNIILILFSG